MCASCWCCENMNFFCIAVWLDAQDLSTCIWKNDWMDVLFSPWLFGAVLMLPFGFNRAAERLLLLIISSLFSRRFASAQESLLFRHPLLPYSARHNCQHARHCLAKILLHRISWSTDERICQVWPVSEALFSVTVSNLSWGSLTPSSKKCRVKLWHIM